MLGRSLVVVVVVVWRLLHWPSSLLALFHLSRWWRLGTAGTAIRSLRLDSASVNPFVHALAVYQCRKALRLTWRRTGWTGCHSSCIEVVLRGGGSQARGECEMDVLQLFGIRSTKNAEFLSSMAAISWSTSLVGSLPRYDTAHEELAVARSATHSMFLQRRTTLGQVRHAQGGTGFAGGQGVNPGMKSGAGKGIRFTASLRSRSAGRIEHVAASPPRSGGSGRGLGQRAC